MRLFLLSQECVVITNFKFKELQLEEQKAGISAYSLVIVPL